MEKRPSAIGLLLWSFILVLLTVQCARRGAPTGGPEDEQPPILLKVEPENYTTNFKGGKIRLEFDEFIKLKEVGKQLVISPPQKNKPLIRPQGTTARFVELTLLDTLNENTTYAINFGQSIVDNNEENPFNFYTYVFSTGDVLDSLEVTGILSDAFKRKVDPFVSIMMYRIDSSYTDSVVYKRLPDYIGSTTDSTSTFSIGNLSAGKYRVVAIKDNNSNNLFDPLTDKIGYVPDTVNVPSEEPLLIRLFKEIPDYRVNTPSLISSQLIYFGYLGNGDSLEVEPYPKLADSIRTRQFPLFDKDTLAFYLSDSRWDTIQFLVRNEPLKLIDTFVVRNRNVPRDSLDFRTNYSSQIPFDDTFRLTATTPIEALDTSKVRVYFNDSIPLDARIRLDSLRNLIELSFVKEPVSSYRVDVLPGAISDFFEQENDTLQYTLRTASLADVGNLTLNLGGSPRFPLILQLTDEKDNVLHEVYSEGKNSFDFLRMKPGTYGIRVIYDRNRNGSWDTGNFLRGELPEPVKYYPGYFELRANWEQIETFVVDPD